MHAAALDDEALQRLCGNAVAELVLRTPRAGRARELLREAVYPELERRYRGERRIGMMRALGYRVGLHDAATPDRRRAILLFVYRNRLPAIRSPEYLAHWGEPASPRRRSRMIFEFDRLLAEAAGDPALSRAVAEWRADREWVRHDTARDA